MLPKAATPAAIPPADGPAPAPAPPTPPPPVAPPADPKGPIDYRAAAIAALEAGEKAEALAAGGEEAPPAEGEAATVEKPAETPEAKAKDSDAEEPKSKLELRALTAVARANRQLREREEALKRREAELKPATKPASAIEALQAAGFSYEQATQEVVTGKSTSPTPKEAPKENPEVAAVQKELKDLREQFAAEREARSRAEVLGTLAQVVAKEPDTFELVSKYASHPRLHSYNRILEVLQEHFANTGKTPGATWEESLRIGAEYVEKELEEQILAPGLTAKKVRGRLAPADTKRESVSGPRAKSGQTPPTTLTNAAVSGAPPRSGPPKPRTEEDYRRAALAVLERGT